jgi:hypothetical protein
MVPCPECKVPQLYRFKPKAGAKRRQCDACRAKRMVPCPECKVPQFYRNKPKAGAKRRQCDACRAKRMVPCPECKVPRHGIWLLSSSLFWC